MKIINQLRSICQTLKAAGAREVTIRMSSKEKLDAFAEQLHAEMEQQAFMKADVTFEISSAMMFKTGGVTLIFTTSEDI